MSVLVAAMPAQFASKRLPLSPARVAPAWAGGVVSAGRRECRRAALPGHSVQLTVTGITLLQYCVVVFPITVLCHEISWLYMYAQFLIIQLATAISIRNVRFCRLLHTCSCIRLRRVILILAIIKFIVTFGLDHVRLLILCFLDWQYGVFHKIANTSIPHMYTELVIKCIPPFANAYQRYVCRTTAQYLLLT